MNASAADTDRVLACGRRVGDLLLLVADGDPADGELAEHVRGCPHCRAELTELDGHWEMVRALGARAVPTPPGLINRVLSSVRGMRGRGGKGITLEQDGGQLRISERALVTLAQELAGRIAAQSGGVHVTAVAMDDDGLQVLLSARYGVQADAAAARVRRRLAAGLREQIGEAAPVVSVHVTDVRRPHSPG